MERERLTPATGGAFIRESWLARTVRRGTVTNSRKGHPEVPVAGRSVDVSSRLVEARWRESSWRGIGFGKNVRSP